MVTLPPGGARGRMKLTPRGPIMGAVRRAIRQPRRKSPMTKKRLNGCFIVKKPIEGVTKAPFSATSRHLESCGGYARFEVIASEPD